MSFQLNHKWLPGNPTVGYVLDNLVYRPYSSRNGLWVLDDGRLGLGFSGDVARWMEIEFRDMLLDPEQMMGDFSYHGFYLTAASRLMEALEGEYALQLIPSGLLFFVGATFFVILAPSIGIGRDQDSLFLHEILQEAS